MLEFGLGTLFLRRNPKVQTGKIPVSRYNVDSAELGT